MTEDIDQKKDNKKGTKMNLKNGKNTQKASTNSLNKENERENKNELIKDKVFECEQNQAIQKICLAYDEFYEVQILKY